MTKGMKAYDTKARRKIRRQNHIAKDLMSGKYRSQRIERVTKDHEKYPKKTKDYEDYEDGEDY